MLLKFSIENYLSIKEKIVLDMEATSDKENLENLIEKNNSKYLKSVVLYGANASGKSNVLSAFNIIVQFLVNSNNMQPGMKIPMIPFKFDSEYVDKPSSFEFEILVNDIKYRYGFKADTNRVYEEYLYYSPNGRESKIFERRNVNEYYFTSEEKELKDIENKNLENKLFLATATTWNYDKTKPVYDFFTNNTTLLFDYRMLEPVAFDLYSNDLNNSLKEFSLKILNEADMNISKYEVKSLKMTDEQLLGLPPEIRERIPKDTKGYNITTSHKITDDNGVEKEVSLDFSEESLGTQNLFILNPFLMDVLQNGKVLIIDELDKSLHPFIVKYIVELFNSEEYNKNNAQLIFTTHDINLLNLNILRRDQIWFTEKDYKKGSTDLYSLSDFSVRKTENVQKGYLNGRYGAIPYISTDLGMWI